MTFIKELWQESNPIRRGAIAGALDIGSGIVVYILLGILGIFRLPSIFNLIISLIFTIILSILLILFIRGFIVLGERTDAKLLKIVCNIFYIIVIIMIIVEFIFGIYFIYLSISDPAVYDKLSKIIESSDDNQKVENLGERFYVLKTIFRIFIAGMGFLFIMFGFGLLKLKNELPMVKTPAILNIIGGFGLIGVILGVFSIFGFLSGFFSLLALGVVVAGYPMLINVLFKASRLYENGEIKALKSYREKVETKVKYKDSKVSRFIMSGAIAGGLVPFIILIYLVFRIVYPNQIFDNILLGLAGLFVSICLILFFYAYLSLGNKNNCVFLKVMSSVLIVTFVFLAFFFLFFSLAFAQYEEAAGIALIFPFVVGYIYFPIVFILFGISLLSVRNEFNLAGVTGILYIAGGVLAFIAVGYLVLVFAFIMGTRLLFFASKKYESKNIKQNDKNKNTKQAREKKRK